MLISLGHHNKLAQNGWLAPTETYVLTGLEPRNEGVSRAMLLLKAPVENSWLWLHNLSLCLLHTAFPVSSSSSSLTRALLIESELTKLNPQSQNP